MNLLNVKKSQSFRDALFSTLSRRMPISISIAIVVFGLGMLSSRLALAAVPSLGGIEGSVITFNEGSASTQVTNALTVTDADNVILSASVSISSNFTDTEDVLSWTPVAGITGLYNASTGVLTFTGSSTPANYRTILRSVRYFNSNTNNPSNLARTISFIVNDGTTDSNIQNRSINVVRVNDAPVGANVEPTAIGFTEGDPATLITSALTIQDVDNPTLIAATVSITSGYSNPQDVLAFTNAFGITGSFNAGSGVLTLSGVATVSDYESALRTVTYQNTNTLNPSVTNRVISFRVNDGALLSTAVTRTVTITAVNDAPVLSAIEVANLTYSEGGAAAAVSATIAVTDELNLVGATVQITGNFAPDDILAYTNVAPIAGSYNATTGTMTLTGTTSVVNYRTAIRAVTFRNSNNNNPSNLVRTVSYSVTDGLLSSNVVSRNITFNAINDVPVLSNLEPVPLSYTEDQVETPVSNSITVVDVDNANLVSATVQINTGYNSTYDKLLFTDGSGITSSFNAGSGTLTLTGTASVATYEAALRTVSYKNTNNINPTTNNRTVRFAVNDGTGSSTAVTRTITFTPVNDAPVLSAVAATDLAYTEGQAATVVASTITITDNDSPNQTGAVVKITKNLVSSEDIISYTLAAGITAIDDVSTGTVTFSGLSSIANYQAVLRSVRYRNSNNGMPSPLTRTISYTLTDESLASNTVTRNVVIAANESVITPEEVALDIPVLAYSTDVNNAIDLSTITITTAPLNGTTSIDNGSGIIKYTPNAEFSGTNIIKYTVKDISGVTSGVNTFTISVSLINDAPSFTAGSDITLNEDAGAQTFAAWATLINDNDPFTSQTLTFTVTNNNNPLFQSQPIVNVSTGNLTFTPRANTSGTATVSVTLRDNGSNTLPNVNYTDTKTFTISVLSVNDAPVGVDDYYSTSSNTPLSASAKSNDTDPEGNTTTLSTTPVVPPANGSVVIDPVGTFVYTPNTGYTGTDSFTYQICDDGTDNGLPASRCGQAVVNVTVNPANAEWNIVGNNSIELAPNSFILTKALNTQQGAIWNRTPLDLRYSFDLDLNAIFSAPGVINDLNGADGIVFVFQRDFTPPPLNVPDLPIYARGASGGSLGVGGITPSFAVEVDTYQNAGDPKHDHISISKDGNIWDNIAGPVPAVVTSANDTLNVEDGVWHSVKISWNNPTKTLTVSFDGVEKLVATNDIANLVFGNDPTNVYWGFTSATGGKNNYQAVKDIVMTVINLPPVAGVDTGTTAEDQSFTGTSVMINDSDPEGGMIHVLAESKNTPHGSVVINADGTYVYTPTPDYNGNDSFTYQVCDAYSPNGCSTGTVDISITPVQDAPIANPDVFSTLEDTQLTVTCDCVTINDVDVDGETLVTVISQPVSHGTLDFHTDGKFTYMPDQDFFGTDTFTYTATDGIDVTTPTLVTINVIPVNDAPIANNDVVNVDEDIPTSLPILTNDRDVDDVLTPSMITIVTPPTHGLITITATEVIYTPQQDYFGPDSFDYTLEDAAGATSSVAHVTINVQPVNDVPVAVADIASTIEDTPVTITVLTNDSDVDNAIDAATVKVVSGPSNGTTQVQADGTIIYTPAKDYFGNDSFTYTVNDLAGGTSLPATVNVAVSPVNDAPVAANDPVTTLENTTIDIHVTDNDFDVDNAVMPNSVTVITSPVHGSIIVNSGVITYVPATDYLGEDSFTYTIEDPDGLTSLPGTIIVTIVPPNRAPVAVEDGPINHRFLLDITIDVLANDYDVDNDHSELSIVSVTTPNIGSVSIQDGKIIYHPEGTTSGTVTFSYTIRDPAGLTDEAVVTIEYVYNPLQVSEGYTPNNDGNNDSWYILSIENYPNNNVKIFDRWGLMVYQKEQYENTIAPWDGRSNIGQQSGKLLDQGTYYYMLDVGGEIKMLSGFVMIVR